MSEDIRKTKRGLNKTSAKRGLNNMQKKKTPF